MKNIIKVSLFALILVGCSQPLAHYSIASTNNMSIRGAEIGDYFEGESCVWRIFGIPTGSMQFRESDALAKALQEAHKAGHKADALSNVTIESTSWTALLFGKSCIVAKGQATSVPK